ncbi:MAG TPA: DUF1203 domain-containing protein [Chthoniobacterales bacterium]|nr:DUF1203 domain-containing protein [Chthoniobacterales bacterium]
MKSSFRISGLPLSNFTPLFALNEHELAQKGARRLIADANPGFPCRVSLQDAEIGERVILLPFAYHPVDSPYRASGPIFVREQADEAILSPNEIPEAVWNRLLSVRAYDGEGIMRGAAVTPGSELQSQIEKFFADSNVSYLHLHNAGAGCYSCRVDRA